MKVSELLERAADTIEKYGHYRGDYGDTGKGMCVLGAINYVETGKPSLFSINPERYKLNDLLIKRGINHYAIYDWSDNAPTQEVLDTLHKLAKEARLEEEGIR